MNYCVQIVIIVCFTMVCVNCIYGEDIIKNEKCVVLASDIQKMLARGEAIDLNNKKVCGLLEIRSCKSLSLQHCQIDSLMVRGTVSGNVYINDCLFENGIAIGPGIVIQGTLKIIDCEFKTPLWINNIEVLNGVMINNVKIHEGIEIENLQSTQLDVIDVQDPGDEVVNTLVNGIPYYRIVKVENVILSSSLHFEGMNVPSINIIDCNVESCVIKENKVDEIVLNNVYVDRVSHIDFQTMPIVGMKFVESNLGQHVRFKLPYHVGDESKIDLSGTVGNFDSLPPPNDMLLMLQCGSRKLEYRQILAMLYKAYETSGSPYDAKSIYERMIKFDLDNSQWKEKPKLYLRYICTSRDAVTSIMKFWALSGLIGFAIMTCFQRFKRHVILVDYTGNGKFPSRGLVDLMSWKMRVKNAAMAAMDGVMPIHISGKYHCYGISYIVYALLKVISWLVIMLFVRSFTL